jgi:hypothetical protein
MCPSQQELRDDFNQKGFEFLMVDLDTALAFTQRARQSADAAVKRRNADHARKAYDTVTRLRKKFELDSEQQNAFEQQLSKLKAVLEQFDEEFNAGKRNFFRQSDVLLDRTKELLIESEPGKQPPKRRR